MLDDIRVGNFYLVHYDGENRIAKVIEVNKDSYRLEIETASKKSKWRLPEYMNYTKQQLEEMIAVAMEEQEKKKKKPKKKNSDDDEDEYDD